MDAPATQVRGRKREPYLCHGVCGETLRPWRRSAKEFPNTRMEYSEHRCIGCWFLLMRATNPGDPKFAHAPCAGCGAGSSPMDVTSRKAYARGSRRRSKAAKLC